MGGGFRVASMDRAIRHASVRLKEALLTRPPPHPAHSTTTGPTTTTRFTLGISVFHLHPHLTTMSILLKGLAAVSAFQPQPPTLEYEGTEYRWKMLTFRPAEFKAEGLAFVALGLYLVLYFIGRAYNMSRAKAT